MSYSELTAPQRFWAGCAVWLLGAISAGFIVSWFGEAVVYTDQFRNAEIVTCQQNGYTWGECWNVIRGDKNAFDK